MAVKSLASAFVNIVPGTKDFSATVKREINDKMPEVGGGAGDEFGKGFNDKLKGAMVGAAALLGGLAIGNYLKDGVQAANDLSGGLREVVTLTGLTGSEADVAFSEFVGGVKDLSSELGVAQGVLTGGLYQALSAGVPRDNVFTFMEVAGKAAIAGVTSTETAVDGLTTIINAFGLEAGEAGAVADSMFAAVKGGKTTFEEMSASLFNVGPAAAAAGVSFQEVNAAIATLTASGTPTSVATTQLRAALTGLQRPSEELDAIFQQLGYTNAQTAIEAEGMGFALKAVKDASGGSNGELQRLLGSVEAVAAANVIAGTGAEKFSTELANQANAAGATDDAFSEIDKSRNLERLNISIENLSSSIGMALLPVIQSFSDIARPVFEFMAENPIVVQTLAIVMGLLAAAFIGVTVATWAMNTALLANPITWIVIAIVAAITLLVAAVVAIVQNWETIVAWLQSVFGPAIQAIGDFFTWLWTDAIQPAIEAIGAAFTWVWETILKPVFDGFMLAIGLLAALYVWLWEEMILPRIQAMGKMFTWLYENVVKPVFDAIGAVFKWIWDYIISPIINYIVGAIQGLGKIFTWLYENIVKPVFDSLGRAFEWIWKNIIQPVVGFITGAIETIGEVVTVVFGFIGTFIGNVFNGLVNVIKAPVNAVIGFINMLIDGLNKIKIDIPDWVPEWGGKTIGFSIAKIPALAKGGYVDQPTTALIGEAGPEVVTPLKDFERMMGLGDGKESKVLNYYAAPNVSMDSEKELFDSMRRAKVVAGW